MASPPSSPRPLRPGRATTLPAQRSAEPTLLVLGEHLYQELVRNLPQSAVYLFDRDLRFVLADGEAMRSADLVPTDVIGKRLTDLVSPQQAAVLEPAYRTALAGGHCDFDLPGDGDGRLYRVRVRPVRATDGVVIGGLVVTDDVTEARRAERDLAATQARWQRLFADAPVGMWLAEPGPDGAILMVNAALCELLGMTEAELLRCRKVDVVQPEDPQAFSAEAARLVAAPGSEARFERRVVRPDGSVRWLTLSAKLIDDPEGPRTLAHFVDVTAIKQAQLAVADAAAFQSAVLHAIPDDVHVATADDGAHEWASRGEGVAGAQVHPDDLPLLRASLRQVTAAADGEVVSVRHRVLTEDGTTRWVDRRKTPFERDADGRVSRYVSVVRDVTDEVEAQLARDEAESVRQAVLTTSPDIVSVYDVASAQTVWASRSLTEMLGWSLAEVQEQQRAGLAGLVHPDDLGTFARNVQRLAQEPPGTVVDDVLRVRSRSGEWRSFARRTTAFRHDAEGRLLQVLNTARDVTEERAQTAELEGVRSFQHAVIATAPDLILVADAATGRPSWTSRPLEELLGHSLEDLLAADGPVFEAVVHPEDLAAFRAACSDVVQAADGEVVRVRYRARHRHGTWRWLSRHMTPFERAATAEVSSYLVTVRDVTDVVEAELQLQRAAMHDPLTGLPNRRLVAERLRTALSGLPRDGAVAVLYLDLDGFKHVNDLHGHAAGDVVLRATAERLAEVLRPEDLVGRMGGDEFVVVLGAATTQELQAVASGLAERLREALSAPVEHAGTVHRVSVSVGIAYGTRDADADDVLRDADTAMFRAKRSGRDRVQVFAHEQHARALQRAALESALRVAVEDATEEVHFQPVVRAATGRLESVEALVRLPDGRGGFLATDSAVRAAERNGLIAVLGDRVLRSACGQASAWGGTLRVAVNMSAHEIARADLHSRVMRALEATGLSPDRLVVELTETVLLKAAPSVMHDLQRLRQAGVGIALDDFGTGYASLRYLATLPVTCVKVDRSFTAGLGRDAVSTTLVTATVRLAQDLGIECVVEGVEREDQLQLLAPWSHVLAQGLHLGAPAPAPDRPEELLDRAPTRG